LESQNPENEDHFQHVVNKASETKSEKWLDLRKVGTANNPSIALCITVSLLILLLIGLVQVYRCNKPWRDERRRPHHQRRSFEDDSASFLTYQKWQQSSRFQHSYNSPLHNLHVRELQKTTSLSDNKPTGAKKLKSPSCSSDSNQSASSSSSQSMQSNSPEAFPEDTFYIEMTANGIQNPSNDILPMELLSFSNQQMLNQNDMKQPQQNSFQTATTSSTSNNNLLALSSATSSLLQDDLDPENAPPKLTTISPKHKFNIW